MKCDHHKGLLRLPLGTLECYFVTLCPILRAESTVSFDYNRNERQICVSTMGNFEDSIDYQEAYTRLPNSFSESVRGNGFHTSRCLSLSTGCYSCSIQRVTCQL